MDSLSQKNSDSYPKSIDAEEEVIKLRTLLSICAQWTWQTDNEFTFNWISRGALEQNAIIAIDIIGKKIWQSNKFTPAYFYKWDKLKELMASKSVFNDFIINYINANNELICISISGVPSFNKNGEFLGYIGVANNISDYQTKFTGSLRLLDRDPVTGFTNWKTLLESFNQGLFTANRRNKSIGFIYIHIPEIITIQKEKSVSSSFEIIKETSVRIRARVRKCDQICRIRLSEICVVLLEIQQESDLEKISQKIIADLIKPFNTYDKEITVKPYMVTYTAPKVSDSLDTLIAKAKKELKITN